MILTVNMMLNHQLQEKVNASHSVCGGREKETEERPIRGGAGELVPRIGCVRMDWHSEPWHPQKRQADVAFHLQPMHLLRQKQGIPWASWLARL